MASNRSVNAYDNIEMPSMAQPDTGGSSDKPLTPRGVRPDSPEELEEWKSAADAQGVSLHQFMLYSVRDLVVRTMQGFRIPQEQVTTTQIKMPKGDL